MSYCDRCAHEWNPADPCVCAACTTEIEARIRADEREACARLIEVKFYGRRLAKQIAAAIRARHGHD